MSQQTPRGRLVRRERSGSLQTVHEEVSGGISSYNARWLDLEVRGVY